MLWRLPCSPELCEEKPYDEKSDVWAFGCLIYELATGKPPFTAANQVALAKKVVHDAPPPLPAQFSAELGNLVHSMLQKNAVHRVSVADILEFPIVKEWVARLANERAVSNSEAAQADAVGRNEIEDILEAEYEQRRALLEKSYQAKLLELEETFQLRIEEAEAATWLARAEEEERHRLELEGAEKQITTLQGRP
jgi:NIMA (never in mitosis gene a)-related kinase